MPVDAGVLEVGWPVIVRVAIAAVDDVETVIG
jgi:hypothetical protein